MYPSSSMLIGFLATGNELVEGDILNTNGQEIARVLTEQGLTIGMHVMTSDREIEIQQALQFLLLHHKVIIITGGLGPTSDDRTRFALSAVLNQSLVFDEMSWSNICERFTQRNILLTDELKISNRQQALFPEDAIILPNLNGSAPGCAVTYQNKKIFMLPGPPHECLPMFNDYVLPELSQQVTDKIIKLRWSLVGAIESEVAQQIDEAVKSFAVTTGYRASKDRRLEVKIYADSSVDLIILKAVVDKIVAPYLF